MTHFQKILSKTIRFLEIRPEAIELVCHTNPKAANNHQFKA